jgi:hypothetical protein
MFSTKEFNPPKITAIAGFRRNHLAKNFAEIRGVFRWLKNAQRINSSFFCETYAPARNW